MKNVDLVKLLLGLIASVSMALASWTLIQQHQTAIQIALLQASVERLSGDKDADEVQDRAIKIFWGRHSWTYDQVNTLRVEHGLGIESWPDVP